MPAVVYREIQRPASEVIAAYHEIPASIASDVLNRMNVMHASIKPLVNNVHLVGPAVTVKCMVGDNIMTHHAIYVAQPGDVLVIDARGHVHTSVWGGIQTFACRQRGIAGVIVDGSVRDLKDIRRIGVPVFCLGVTPAGPHKGWGGSINEPIQCGGVAVMPGDLIVADDDGVTVVPREQAERLIPVCRRRMAEEDDWVRRVGAGEATTRILGLDEKLEKLGVEWH